MVLDSSHNNFSKFGSGSQTSRASSTVSKFKLTIHSPMESILISNQIDVALLNSLT